LALINAGAADTPFQITELPGAPGLERGGALSHQVPVVTLPDGFPQTYSEYIASGLPAPTLQPVAPTISAVAPENLSFYYDRGTFDADYPGLPVEGLENGSMPYGSVDSVPHPLDQYSSNAYFDPGDILPGIQFWASVTHLGDEIAVFGEQFMSNPTKTAGPNYFVDSYIIMFDPPVAAAGMDLQELMSATQCQVDVYDTNGYLGSDISNCDATGVFWGVASDENPITEIVVTSLGLGGEVVDNIAFGGEISVDIPWLSEDPIEGTVVADNSTEVSVTIVVTPEMPLGDYFAQLNVKTEDPEKGKIKVPVTLHVVPEYLAPVVTFDSNTPVMLGDTMLFTNTTTDLGIPPVKVFEWNFGDGTVEDYGLTDPVTHVYTAARLYDVTVTACSVPDKCGTATVTVEVRKAPDASFTSNSPVVLGSPVVFTNTTVDGFPDDTTYAWDFGDGGTSTDADPTHTYAARGIYSVTLTACNSVPLCDTFVAEVEVTGTAPVAAFTSNSPVTLGNPMVFTNTTVAGEPAETTYEWDFGDDAGTSTDVNPTYTYDEVGTYTVTLTACNLVGCTTFSADVVVNPVVIEQRNIFLPLVNSH
jgi:PKD repeat protein